MQENKGIIINSGMWIYTQYVANLVEKQNAV